MKNDPVELLAPFRKRLAELAPKTSANQVERMSLPALYEAALQQTPRLHSDHDLCVAYKALGVVKEMGDDGVDYWVGIETWINAGMSPVIYFTGFPEPDSFARSYLQIMQSQSIQLPNAQALLGNLSLQRFTQFWTDHSSLLNYNHACEIIGVIPELLTQTNWRNFQAGEINLHPRAKKQLDGRLRRLVPLLCLHENMDDADYYFAKNSLQLNNPDDKQFLVTQAIWGAADLKCRNALERLVHLEFRGWDNVTLDNILINKINNRSHFLNIEERDFWIAKAIEVINLPDRAYVQAWPSALYASIVHLCNTDSFTQRTSSYETTVAQCPAIEELGRHASESAYALARGIDSSRGIEFKISPLTLSILKPEHRKDFIGDLVRDLATNLLSNIKNGRQYFEPILVQKLLRDADPLWATAITEWVQRHFSMRDFKPSDSGMAAIVVLLTYPLRGVENKEKAITWCRAIRSPKWKIEAMHALNLSPQDININDHQKEDFLSRDLGL
jgi:hypothetical protein